MDSEKVYAMKFSRVFPMLIAKAERKGRTEDEVFQVTQWLTGYTRIQIETCSSDDTTYGDFFRNAPCINPEAEKIKGKICGIQIENIEDPLMQLIRRLDKLVDELAKGKSIDKILNR